MLYNHGFDTTADIAAAVSVSPKTIWRWDTCQTWPLNALYELGFDVSFGEVHANEKLLEVCNYLNEYFEPEEEKEEGTAEQ